MEKQKKVVISTSFFLALFGIVLIVISLATDHWVESAPKGTNGTDYKNVTYDVGVNRRSDVNFGLFNGFRTLNYGWGRREASLKVSCMAEAGVCVVYPDGEKISATDYINKVLNGTDGPLYEKGLFNYGFWVTSIISAALCIVFGLISMGFAIFNVCGKPIETITGPMGLYLWNGTAFLFAVLDMVMFLVLFLTSLKKNFLLEEDQDRFLVPDYTNLGYSFYLVLGAVAMYLINIILLVSSGYKLRCSFSSEAEKVVDNGMILY